MSEKNRLEQLFRIKELYSMVKQVTIGIVEHFSADDLNEALKNRDELLCIIGKEEAAYRRLGCGSGEHVGECKKIVNEIRDLILSTLNLDKELTLTVENSMQQVRSELSGLYKTSRAAVAYSAQRRY